MKILRLKSICIILIILTLFSVFATGCSVGKETKSDSQDGLQGGLYSFEFYDELPHIWSAYKSDKRTFDINNVTLDFYYGVNFPGSEEHERQTGCDIPSFDLYFEHENREKIFIKHVEENLVSDKYRAGHTVDSKPPYNHSEKLTIPKEMFKEEYGFFRFVIYGTDIKEREATYKSLTSAAIYYRCKGDKVTLSSVPFERLEDDAESNENNSKFNFGFFSGCSGV